MRDFSSYVESTTKRLREASTEEARRLNRPIIYLASSQSRKELITRKIRSRDGITDGLICVLRCVEPCISYYIRRDRPSKKLFLERARRKCLHLYHYWIDPVFGFMSGRVQTWFPFSIQPCPNGREWLSRQMDQVGMRYKREGNCFLEVEDFPVFRPLEGNPKGACAWRPMRKGIGDLPKRARISQGSNERYLDGLAVLDTDSPIFKLIDPVCRTVLWKGRRERALRPWSEEDQLLLHTITRGELSVNGFRNRDLLPYLFTKILPKTEVRRGASARVTRKLRLLRAHGSIRKVANTHRYVLTKKGREIVLAILKYQSVTLDQLEKAAA